MKIKTVNLKQCNATIIVKNIKQCSVTVITKFDCKTILLSILNDGTKDCKCVNDNEVSE